MAKQSTAPQQATQEDNEDLPQTAVKPSAKEIMLAKLAEYENQAPPEQPPADLTPSEEATWKKRYADLRRHAQKEETTLKSQLSSLQAQVEQLTQAANQPMPKSREEFEAWKEKFPDVVPFIEMLADEKATSAKKQIEEELTSIKETLAQTEKEKAFATLKVMVPDLEAILGSDSYKKWFTTQPQFVQDELNTSDDPSRITYWMNVYKMATNTKPVATARKDNKLDALDTSVRNSGPTPGANAGKWSFTQSQIAKMSTEEYTAKEADIIEARNSGKILDDMSRRNTVFDQ